MKPITISLSPNTEYDDVLVALKEILTPWRWFTGSSVEEIQEVFRKLFKTDIYFYNSGRSALYELLRAFGIGSGDEVIVQSFTCVAVPNSALWNGAIPIYADVDETYNINVETIKKVRTQKTKVIIVQHTFGIPAPIEEIVRYAKKENILVIEDCAHSLGAAIDGKLVGTFGDAAFFSFGRDKVVSSVFGGAAMINPLFSKGISSGHSVQTQLAKDLQSLPYPRRWWVFQQLFHPLAFAIVLPLYGLFVGKLLLVVFQKLSLLSFPVYKEECEGKRPHDFPKRYPPVLARLLLNQMKKIDRYNRQRQKTAELYRCRLSTYETVTLPPAVNGALYMRFPLLVKNPDTVISDLKHKQILIGNWYRHTIDPKRVDFNCVGYTKHSCPTAELMAQHVINLPTRISLQDAERVITYLQKMIQ